MRIGVDVGGTNTDAVIMDGRKVVASCKAATTENVSSGIVAAISEVLTLGNVLAEDIDSVMIGTTQFTNAFVERKHILPVAVFRIALPATAALPPMVDWPDDFCKIVGDHHFLVRGGHHFDGRPSSPFDPMAVAEGARQMKKLGIRAAAITSMFSPVNAELEERAREIVLNEVPDAAVTLSSKIGKIGLLERENATIMNACLADLAGMVVGSFRDALLELGITAPFHISQNDGTLMTAEHVQQYPVLTFASGPTNSMRGAAYLSGATDALVADIGGTTTDIGMLTNGFPRESALAVDIGNVRTNFRMPDIFAIGLGGGSLVTNIAEEPEIGPQSVGYRLSKESLVFGGSTLTATDIAVASGSIDLGDVSRVKSLDASLVKQAKRMIHQKIADGVDRMKTSGDPVPLILVGGGSILISEDIAGTSETIIPEQAGVANAIGASVAQIGGEVDRVVSYEKTPRDEALEEIRADAEAQAIRRGAKPGTIEMVDIDEVPMAYVPGGAVRLRIKVAGDLDFKPMADGGETQ